MLFGSLCHKKNDTIQNTVTQKAVTTLCCLFSFFLFLFLFFLGCFGFEIYLECFTKMLNDRRVCLWHVNSGGFFGVLVSTEAYSFQAFHLVSHDFPISNAGLCLILAMQKPEQSRIVCQTPSPVASWMVLIYSPRKTILHLLLVLGMASSFTNQASSVSESVHVLAVGQFYGLLPWQSMWHAEQDCFL